MTMRGKHGRLDPTVLGGMFAPATVDHFFARHWQRAPALSDPGRTPSPLSLADVDELVASATSLDEGWLMLTKNGMPKPNEAVRSRDGSVDPTAVHAAYDEGYTLILTMLQRRLAKVGDLCRGLERELLARGAALAREVRANLYLTPPRSRGFDPHYDDHDVVVLQIEGEKRWKIYGQHHPRPIGAQRRQSQTLPPLVLEATLRPGQALYVPRGFYHEASTGPKLSLHLTLGIAMATWIDLFSRLLPGHEPMREALPLRRSGGGFRREFERLARGLIERGGAEEAAHRLADEAVASLAPLPDDGFGQRLLLSSLAPDTRLRRRRGAIIRLRGKGEGIVFPGNGLRGPQQTARLLRFVAASESFRVRDLPTKRAEDRLELARTLVLEGLLRIDS